MLNLVKNSFETSSLKVKIELYILPILIIFLFYILIFEQNIEEFEEKQNIDSVNFENKKYDKPILELLNNIEQIAKNSNIFIQKSENIKDEIFLQAKSNKDDLLKFLHKIENLNSFTNIHSLSLKKVKFDSYLFDLKVDVSKFYIKKIVDLEEVKKSKIIKNSSAVDFKIDAIIGKYAFINDNWVELNDFINGYKLDFVSRNFVLLTKEDETIRLEVNSIEYLENTN